MSQSVPLLPVSGWDLRLRPLRGAEELLLREAQGNSTEIGLRLLDQLATDPDGKAADCAVLTVTDFECLLIRLRQMLSGQRVLSDFHCRENNCGERVEVAFDLDVYVR